MVVRKNSRFRKFLFLVLVAGLVCGQIEAISFDIAPANKVSISWFKNFAQSAVTSLFNTRVGKLLSSVASKKSTKQSPSVYMPECENICEEKKESDNKVANNKVANFAVLQKDPIAETVTATMHTVEVAKKSIAKKNKNEASAQVIQDAVIAGAAGTATPVGMCVAQYLTGNQLIDAASIIPAAQLSIATTMVNKLHGIKEGTEAVDAVIGAAIIGASAPAALVGGAIAEVSAIVSEVIEKNGGIVQIAQNIDWFDVAAGSTKKSEKENKYNAGLIKEVQKLTKNKESAKLLTTVTVSALENAVMYSVLGLLGISTGGAGLVAVAGSAATYGAAKGLINYLVQGSGNRAGRSGFIAGITESVALKHALKIGGSLAAVDALPIIATELAVSIVQTMVHNKGGWDAVTKKLGFEVVEATKKRLHAYKQGIEYALEKLKKVTAAVVKDVDNYMNYVNCGPFPLESDIQVEQESKELKKEKKSWFTRWFNGSNSFDDNEFIQSLNDGEDESDDEDVFYDAHDGEDESDDEDVFHDAVEMPSLE